METTPCNDTGSTQTLARQTRCGCGCVSRLAGDGRAELARVAAAETLGTALLVLLSCLPACLPAPPLPAVHTALASGFVVAMLVQALDHISGAMFNPTVTAAAVVWGRVSVARAGVMLGAQVAGGAAGAALLVAVLPEGGEAGRCVTAPGAGVAPWTAALVEAVLGGCLALVNCAAWDPRNHGLRDSWPLRIGTSVAAMSLVAGTVTGASMNPVRSLGPAMLLGQFQHHWVYWVGPLCGGVCAAWLYCAVWRPPPRAPPLAPHPPPRTASHRDLPYITTDKFQVDVQRDNIVAPDDDRMGNIDTRYTTFVVSQPETEMMYLETLHVVQPSTHSTQ